LESTLMWLYKSYQKLGSLVEPRVLDLEDGSGHDISCFRENYICDPSIKENLHQETFNSLFQRCGGSP
jgi:hypothetical protein